MMMFYHILLLKDMLSQGHSALLPEQFALCNTIASLQHSVMAFHRHTSLHGTKPVIIWIPAGKGSKAGVVKGMERIGWDWKGEISSDE